MWRCDSHLIVRVIENAIVLHMIAAEIKYVSSLKT
jgi:hypothetical protein